VDVHDDVVGDEGAGDRRDEAGELPHQLADDRCLIAGGYLRTEAKDWPALTRQAVEDKGQSYRKALENALNAGFITEQVASYQLRQVA
jgi:hypothetical protein